MKRLSTLFCTLVLLLTCSLAAAASQWPRLEAALSAWEGERTITLRSDLSDPLADPLVQSLLEKLLSDGFAVLPASLDAQATAGLTLDLRSLSGQQSLLLGRATDGAFIALDKLPLQTTSAPKESPAPAPVTVAARPQAPPLPVPPPAKATGALRIDGKIVAIAPLEKNREGLSLALLTEKGIERITLTDRDIQRVKSTKLPLKNLRALSIDSGDLDGDGIPELAALWSEDRHSIYDGTDSHLHSWVFSGNGDFTPLSDDLEGFLRITQGKGLWQQRGKNSLADGPIRPLLFDEGKYRPGTKSLPWGPGDLLAATPLDATSALVWREKNSLEAVRLPDGAPLPGGVLLEDWGPFVGGEVAIPLAEPEFRLGFGREGRVTEQWYPLARRIVTTTEGTAYTIQRRRTEGIPLVGHPSGQDRVVRIVQNNGELRIEHPFAGVEAYILDFALVEKQGSPEVVLLLNEKPDGSGQAYLQRLQAQ